MAAEFHRMVQAYQGHFGKTREEAIALVNEITDADSQRIAEAMPDQISWADLHQVSNTHPERGLDIWGKIEHAAREELQTGHRAATALNHGGQTPWERAQFLALRRALAEEWRPANGIENQLIDTMAIAQASFMYWTQKLAVRTALQSVDGKRLKQDENLWVGPRLTDAEAMEQAAEMADRFNRMFLRTLRALRDLRRHGGRSLCRRADS
jgi:hypothetical protein